MSDLFITTTNSNADDSDSVVKIDLGTINQLVTPSTVRKENEVISFHR